jgi:hypothetical protein
MSSTLTLWTNAPGATIRLWSEAFKPVWAETIEAGHSSEGAWDERKTDDAGNTSFMFVPAGRATAYITAPGFIPTQFDTVMPDDGAKTITLEREPLPPLAVRGQRFYRGDQPWFLKGASMFTLFQRFLDGEDVRPQLQQLTEFGTNCIRVFGMFHYINVNEFGKPAFKPQDYGDRFYDLTPAFSDLSAEFGLYVYWSCFPDNDLIMPTHAQRRAHFDRWVPALQSRANNLFELTNEQDAHAFNRVDAALYPKPNGMASCAGSYGDVGGPMPPPYWDFLDYHAPRYYPAGIKDCCLADHPNFLRDKSGILLGEPDRFGSNGNSNAEQARQSAGTSIGTALGIVFHSWNGVRGEVFDSETRRCAEAFYGPLKGV